MPQFSVNAQRLDPYKNFKFRVKWDGKYVAGVSKVSALKRTTDPVEHRSGGDPSTVHKSPGQTKYDAITLERGVTHDQEFEKWANKVWNFGSGLGSEVEIAVERDRLIIRPAACPRTGWNEQFRAMAERGDDRLLDETVPTHWEGSEWTW